MKLPIYIEGKKYKLSYFKYIAYHSLKRIERLEKKIARLENELKKVFKTIPNKDNQTTYDFNFSDYNFKYSYYLLRWEYSRHRVRGSSIASGAWNLHDKNKN